MLFKKNLNLLILAVDSYKTEKKISHEDVKLFIENSIMVLDLKMNKFFEVSYSVLSKCFNYWKIDSVF